MSDIIYGLLYGVVLGLMLGIGVGAKTQSDSDAATIGTAAHVCFANHTCRDAMRCVTGIGMEDGVCVK